LAIVKSTDKNIEISCLLRSSVDSAKMDLAEMMASVFELAGAKCSFDGAYPGWKPNMKSPILETMQSTYKKMFGKTPAIMAIHAGLECGLLGGVYPSWDMISFGPTIQSPHSPDERVNIASVKLFWEYLVETLKNVPVK
jgi:dipeptidase D